MYVVGDRFNCLRGVVRIPGGWAVGRHGSMGLGDGLKVERIGGTGVLWRWVQ